MEEPIGPRAIKMEAGGEDTSAWMGARSANELRQMASRLLELANTMDRAEQRVDLAGFTSHKECKGEVSQDALCKLAEAIYRGRNRRSLFLPDCVFSEPGWDMLLDLFARDGRGQNTSTTSICLAAIRR